MRRIRQGNVCPKIVTIQDAYVKTMLQAWSSTRVAMVSAADKHFVYILHHTWRWHARRTQSIRNFEDSHIRKIWYLDKICFYNVELSQTARLTLPFTPEDQQILRVKVFSQSPILVCWYDLHRWRAKTSKLVS